MSRHRGRDWEGIIIGVGALLLLFAILTGYHPMALVSIFFFLVLMAVVAGVLIFTVVGVSKWMIHARSARMRETLPGYSPQANLTLGREVVLDALNSLDWFQLERLVARLFEAKGCAVQLRGGANPDGGIDMLVQTETAEAAVQCKHWEQRRCGPAVVRELLGSMLHENISQGFLICRQATADAKTLAASHRIQVIEREGLMERIQDMVPQSDSSIYEALFYPQKICPKCGAEMVLRTTSKGANMGQQFWGCSEFPRCRQIMKQ